MDKHYAHYTTEDFLNDADFRRWVLTPTSGDEQFWVRFLSHTPSQCQALAEARVLLLHFQHPDPVSPAVTDQDWQRLQNALTYRPVRRIGWIHWVAASVVLLFGTSLLLWLNYQTRTVYETGYGQTRQIILDDGTRVTLNANSRLSVKGHAREVWLRGEGFFEVRKTADLRQFKVHADQLDVVVLGTSFNVRNRRAKTNVVLQEGQVRLQMDHLPSVQMKPGDLVEINDRNQLRRRLVNPKNYRAWMQNRLVFEATTVSEVLQSVEDLYGIRIDAQGAFVDEKLTASLPAGKAEYVLNALAGIYSLTLSSIGNQYILREK